MFLSFDDSLEGSNGRSTNLPGFVVVVIVFLGIFFRIVVIVIILVIKFFVTLIVRLFVVVVIAVRVVWIVAHVRQRSLDDFLQMRLDLRGTPQHEGFESHEAGFPEFVGERDRRIILHHVLVVITTPRRGRIIVDIVIIPRDGIFRLGEFQKYGQYPIDLRLLQTMSHGTTHGTHGPYQRPRISPTAVDLTQETFDHANE
mmetsp:Transcript_18441/g.28548  ORF Transcript_18441/g.28548 Transcript_18441/m.28548 type:complete len:200 (+) Transcript_18441:404-1003(+)